MERFKKRTIALVLASVVTVVGAFGASNYKNTLMGIKFESPSNGNVNLILETKSPHAQSITPMRRDANTYIITLPEVNNMLKNSSVKDDSGIISSMDVRTMPYSNTAKGYTRITIKTLNPSININTQNRVFIPDKNAEQKQITQKPTTSTQDRELARKAALEKRKQSAQREALKKQAAKKKLKQQQATPKTVSKSVSNQSGNSFKTVPIQKTAPPVKRTQNSYLWLYALLIFLASSFFYVRAKNKMQELAGESIDIDVRDNSQKNKNIKRLKSKINSLDATYSKTPTNPYRNEYTQTTPTTPIKTVKPAEELNVVDLDELFQEHKSKQQAPADTKEQEENEALEDFLSGFSFDDTFGETIEEPEDSGYDEEFYNEVIKNKNLKFSKEDLECIAQLLETEINDDTLRNIDKYAVSSPIKKVIPKEKIMEDLITTYAISQKIIFTENDIKILNKLINVELDSDFVTDLRTSTKRTAEMQQDIISYGDKPKKPSKIVTLNVKDMLPDLSEALKQQGDKKIESNHKAETVYFSKGYDVKTLKLSENLPDLTIEINKKGAFNSKPSAEYDIVDTSYVVGDNELKIASELPDLSDVLANPEKYAEPEPEEVIVDEEALLKNISNVQFKPFYDGTTEFEILNHFDEDSDTDSEINIEDFDTNINAIENKPSEGITEPVQNEYTPVKLERNIEKIKREQNTKANDLIKKIEASKPAQQNLILPEVENNTKRTETDKIPTEMEISTSSCVVDNEILTIVNTVKFVNNMGCHLAKGDDGYTILGYIGDQLFKIKHYQILKTEKIQARISDKLPNGILRYIVRIGLHKFIVDIDTQAAKIEYVMDLC